jgi:hypothetical protein
VFSSGDLWWDSANNQLKISNTNQIYTIGPAFPQSIGSTGWVLPDIPLVDAASSISQDVLLLENHGSLVGALSNETFDLTHNDFVTYFKTASTATLVQGLNIFGNIHYSGQINHNHLSATVDLTRLDELSGGERTMGDLAAYNKQNLSITKLLTTMFPIIANTLTNEVGLPLGSSARVTVNFPDAATPSGYNTNHMHVRRFSVVNKTGVGLCWQPTEIYDNTSTANTVVPGLTLVNIMPYTV